MTSTAVLHAYRHLYRAALRAVRHSVPAKYQVRDTMRSAFRTGTVETLNLQRVNNTMRFLRQAESHAGMEHKILQNLLHVRYWQRQGRRDNRLVNQQTDLAATIRKNSWAQFDATLKMLNESLHTCLR